MSIESYFDNLRSKPEHVRRRYAFWSSFGFTAILFMFWIGSFTDFGLSNNKVVAAAADKISSPSQSLVAGVGALGKDVWEMIFGTKKVQYSEVEVLPGK